MKTENVLSKSALVHRLLKKGCEKTRKISKFVVMYGLCIGIIGIFDYAWMPFLAIKFQYLAFFPLYVSLIIVCISGLGLYELFKEDIFLKEKFKVTLNKEGKYKFTRWLKEKMNSSPKIAFMVISLENPLQAYIYFRERDEVKFSEAIKLIATGSFYCAFFWGVIISVLVFFFELLGDSISSLIPWVVFIGVTAFLVNKIKKFLGLWPRRVL